MRALHGRRAAAGGVVLWAALTAAADPTTGAQWVEHSDAVLHGNVEFHERARMSGAREIAAQMQEQEQAP